MLTNYPTKPMKELFTAILSLENEKEAAAFFRDLLTVPELAEFANRWQIVKLLNEKKSYLEIAKQLNVSTTTVTRVSQWLHNGMGGYKSVVKKVF
jgi:TrpR-related protein YerC/YecD